MIDGLPANSYYVEAQLNDEEIAGLVAKAPPRPPRRRMAEWSPEVDALAAMVDRLSELILVQLRRAGTKNVPAFKPYLRPTTAVDRLRDQQRIERHESLVDRVLPHRRREVSS